MYRTRVRLLAAATVIAAVSLLSTDRFAKAEEPETVSVTFALEFPCAPQYEDPAPQLSDFLGEDTVAILIGEAFEVADALHFDAGSPPCGDVAVADSSWSLHADGTIVNKGGPIRATVRCCSLPKPPAHAVLIAQKITDVHACWLEMEGDGDAVAQDAWDWYTSGVFIIVTGEFRVRD